MSPLLGLILLPLISPAPPRVVQAEVAKLFSSPGSPGVLEVKEDFAKQPAWRDLFRLPSRVNLAANIGWDRQRLWLGVEGPRKSFTAPLAGCAAVNTFLLETRINPGKGMASILLGRLADGRRLRLDFSPGPVFSLMALGPKGGRVLRAPDRHRLLRAYPLRIGVLRTPDRLWLWTGQRLIMALKLKCGKGQIGLQVTNRADERSRAFFDDLRLLVRVPDARLAGRVLVHPGGPPASDVAVLATWPGGVKTTKVVTAKDGAFALVVPVGSVIKVRTGAATSGSARLRISFKPGKKPIVQQLVLPPGKQKELRAYRDDKLDLTFYLRPAAAENPDRPVKK